MGNKDKVRAPIFGPKPTTILEVNGPWEPYLNH